MDGDDEAMRAGALCACSSAGSPVYHPGPGTIAARSPALVGSLHAAVRVDRDQRKALEWPSNFGSRSTGAEVITSGQQLHRRRQRETLCPLRQSSIECRESGST